MPLTGDTAVNLTAVADDNGDGTYTLSVTVGDLKPMTVQVMKSANVGVVYLTSGSEEHDREYVDASKSNEVSDAMMQLVRADGTIVYDSGLKELKARGNSTFTYAEKKSYQIKLDDGTDLLGNGEEVKTWVLLAGYFDATQMHDKLFKDLAAELEMPFTPSSDWIDLFYDGEYRGTYLLSEKVSVNDTSVDVTDMEKSYEYLNDTYGEDPVISTGTNAYGQEFLYTEGLTDPENITGGYLIELNDDGIDEASGFHTTREQPFNVKSPEWASEAAMAYISEYYQAFEDAVYATDASGNYTGYNEETGKYYYEYCDMDSLVQAFVLQELSLNPDGFRSSLFFYKDVDGIMYAGPVWDMEMTLGSGWEKYISTDVQDYHYLAEALIKIPEFKAAVKEYLRDTFLPEVETLLGSSGKIAIYKERIADSTAMNYILWPYVRVGSPAAEDHLWAAGTTYDDVVTDMSQWLRERVDVLKETFGLKPSSGGGGGVTTYSVTVPTNVENGTVSVSPSRASAGSTVTVTITSQEGYSMDTLTVTDQNGSEVELTKVSDTQYTFKMPKGAVEIDVSFTEAVSTLPFADVDTGDWFYDAVKYAYDNELMNGVGGNYFDPDGSLNRAMLVTMLWRMEGEPMQLTDIPFTDVPEESWYTAAVRWAYGAGIVDGMTADTFAPAKAITRQQMAAMLYRYAQFKGYDTTQSGMSIREFADYDRIADWALEPMDWAVNAGLMSGRGGNMLVPDGEATRAEIAKVVMLFRETIAQ